MSVDDSGCLSTGWDVAPGAGGEGVFANFRIIGNDHSVSSTLIDEHFIHFVRYTPGPEGSRNS
jgi:hypothetical protein